MANLTLTAGTLLAFRPLSGTGMELTAPHAVSDTGDTLRWLSVDASAVFAAEVDNRNVLYRGAYSKLHYVPQSIVCMGLCTVTRLASDCLMYGP